MPKKQTYTVYVRYLATIEVEAENESKAADMALQTAFSEGEFETLDVTVETPSAHA
jgi:hypothetical protein